jgi:hypothetical protein
MKDNKKAPSLELKGSIFELLHSFELKNTTDRKTPIAAKLSNMQQTALKSAGDLKPLSAQQLAKIKPILLSIDPGFSLLLSIALLAFENKKSSAVIVEDCAKLISVLAFNMSTELSTSIYFSLKSCSSDKVDLERFAIELSSEHENAGKVKSKNVDEDNGTDASQTISSATNKKQTKNLTIIGLLWCLSKGRVESGDVIEYLGREYSKELVLNGDEKRQVAIFLNKMLDKSDSKSLFLLVKYYIDKVAIADRQRMTEQAKVASLEEKIASLTQSLSIKEAQAEKHETDLSQLQSKIAQLENSLDSQKKLGTADVVHLKDDHNKVKSKTLNLLEEDVIPLLQTSLHALNKDTPKTHVAIHNIDLVLENIEGTIKWLKK